jgi:hypothetical protein
MELSVDSYFLGLMHFSEWMFGQFVTWTHATRLHYRRMKSEPDPKAVHN